MKTRIQSLLHFAVLACAVWLLFACSAESMSVHDVEGEYNGTVDAVVSLLEPSERHIPSLPVPII